MSSHVVQETQKLLNSIYLTEEHKTEIEEKKITESSDEEEDDDLFFEQKEISEIFKEASKECIRDLSNHIRSFLNLKIEGVEQPNEPSF